MNLSDALGDDPPGNQSGGGGVWPGQTNPTWPGQPPANPAWPGGPAAGGAMWPGGNQPAWPSPSTQPAAPGGWPSPAPGPGPAPGGWPSPAPGPGPAPGGWPGPAPGGWPGPAPGPGPGPGPAPGGWPGPAPGPGPGPGPAFPTAPQQNLTVPFSLNLPRGGHDKLLITIAGTVKPNPDKITVNLCAAKDLAFHFNPRFNESGRQVIVRNSLIRDTWGREERELPHFPFSPGQRFEIKILFTSREFKVAVNDSHLLDYKHRITDLTSITTLNIYNDITLTRVHMETLP